jgi:hypothetical protein
MMPVMLFGGEFANSATLQAWISWLQYASPIRYAFEAIIINEFDPRTYDAAKGESNPRILLGFHIGMWRCLVVLASIAILLRLVSLFFLRVLVSKFQ